jgi:hypothetical protein
VTATLTATATVQPTETITGTVTPTVTPVTPTPIPVPGEVHVPNHRSFREGNTLYVVGDVVNDGAATVFAVTIIATFYDSDDQIEAVQESRTLLPATMPTQHNPFKLGFTDAPASIEDYSLALTWDDISVVDYERLTVLSEEVRDDNGIEIFGELRNDHPFEMSDIHVVVTFYDGEGNVVDVFEGQVNTPTLAPASTTSYSVSTSKADLAYESFLVQTQGMRALRAD